MEPTTVVFIAVAFVVGYVLGGRGKGDRAPDPPPPDPAALARVRPILSSEGKIAAIRAYREDTGAGLREAKLAVDTLTGS